MRDSFRRTRISSTNCLAENRSNCLAENGLKRQYRILSRRAKKIGLVNCSLSLWRRTLVPASVVAHCMSKGRAGGLGRMEITALGGWVRAGGREFLIGYPFQSTTVSRLVSTTATRVCFTASTFRGAVWRSLDLFTPALPFRQFLFSLNLLTYLLAVSPRFLFSVRGY